MARKHIFSFKLNDDEQRMLLAMADRLQRTKADTVRLLLREAAAALLESETATAPIAQQGQGGGRG